MPLDSLSPETRRLLDSYQLPAELGFGVEVAPVMFRADYLDGEWQSAGLVPYGPIAVDPVATSLQFGQQAFEGMKAYKADGQNTPRLFRPELNYRRLCESAARLCMQPPSAEVFARALCELSLALQSFIPGGNGQSLYLRPTLIGMDRHFAVHGSDHICFVVVASPSGAYYADPIRVRVEREHCRAAVGGTGAQKVGGNYGASLLSTRDCNEQGFGQPLWLDPASRRNVEELSGMNVMAVINGELHTPALSGSILAGVTRDSLLRLADRLGMAAVERTMPVDELLADIDAGRCSELFACGTGAIVCPISALGDVDGSLHELPKVGEVAGRLRAALLDTQEGRAADEFGWMQDVDAQDALALRVRAAP